MKRQIAINMLDRVQQSSCLLIQRVVAITSQAIDAREGCVWTGDECHRPLLQGQRGAQALSWITHVRITRTNPVQMYSIIPSISRPWIIRHSPVLCCPFAGRWQVVDLAVELMLLLGKDASPTVKVRSPFHCR